MVFRIPEPQDCFITSQAVYQSIIPSNHFLVRVAKSVDFTFINEDMKDTYCPDNGRPTTNYPSRMLKALWLSIQYDMTDREMEERANQDIVIKWFLGYNIGEKAFDHSALGAFRERLGEEGCKEAFFKINKQIETKGLIVPGESQTIDATHVLSKTAHLTVPQMIHRGVVKLFREIHLLSPELEQEIKDAIGFEGDITKIPKEYGMSKAERLDRLTRLVLLAEGLVEAFSARVLNYPENEKRARVVSAAEILHRIINEQTEEETSKDGKVKRKKKALKDKPKDRIASPVDPNARHGHKTSKKPFLGYKVSLTENEKEIVTNIEVDPGNFVDGDAQIPMCDELEDRQGKRPEKVTGDKAYGDGKVRHTQKEKGTRVVAPLKKPAAKKDKYPQSMFKYNPETSEVTCPGGRKARRIGYNKKYKCTMYKFLAADCGKCPQKDLCTDAKARSINISDFEPYFREAAEYKKTDEYKDDMKRRAGHERKNCEMKKKHGMERARYWGVKKVRIQAYLTAMTVNIKRFIKLLYENDDKKPNGVESA